MDTGIGGQARRGLAVLAVVLGLLAMHGLASGHHGAVPPLTAAKTATTGVEQHAVGAAHGSGHTPHQARAAAALAVPPLHDVLADGCVGDCEHPSGLVLLCVAVLLAAGLALVLGLARRTWRTVPATGPPSAGRRRLQVSFRRLDLVADLCVSRT